MKKIVLAFLLSCLFLTNCKKNNDDTGDIIGKWKLIEVSIYKNYQQYEITDYSKKNIVYDFQENNKLIVTGNIPNLFIFDDFQEGEHFYEYFIPIFHPNGLTGKNLTIDKPNLGDSKGHYYCSVSVNEKTIKMGIGSDKVIGGVIDETGLITGGDFFKWDKTFVKLK